MGRTAPRGSPTQQLARHRRSLLFLALRSLDVDGKSTEKWECTRGAVVSTLTIPQITIPSATSLRECTAHCQIDCNVAKYSTDRGCSIATGAATRDAFMQSLTKDPLYESCWAPAAALATVTPAPAACENSSKSLVPADCAAWVDIYDATNGSQWAGCKGNRLDPCGCSRVTPLAADGAPRVACTSDNTHITRW
jgi:hypothetical protein